MAEGAAAASAAVAASITVGAEEASCSNNISPQLCLQWHHHQKSVVDLLDRLWEKQELVDVTLAADGRFIHVHRIVLCASSDYFQDILTDKDHEDKHAIIILKDVEFADLQALVHYLYKGEVRINENQLSSFINTAKSLGIRGLMREDEAKAKEAGQRKRRRSDSEGESCDEDSYSSDEGLSNASSIPPPPPPLKHKTSLSKNTLDVKKESQSTANEMQQHSHNINMITQTPHYSHHSSYSHHHVSHHPHHQHSHPSHHSHHHHHHQASTIETMKNSAMTPNDLDTNGLGMFPCPGDPGPSRSSEDDSNLHHQPGNGWPSIAFQAVPPAPAVVAAAASLIPQATNGSGSNNNARQTTIDSSHCSSNNNNTGNNNPGSNVSTSVVGHQLNSLVSNDTSGSLYSLLLQTYGTNNGPSMNNSGHGVAVAHQTDASNDSQLEDEDSDATTDGATKVSGHFSRIAAQAIVPSKRSRRNLTGNGQNRNRPLYSCNRCGRIYSKKHSVLRHLRYECGVEPQFQCTICHQRFKHRSDQQRHQRKIHNLETSAYEEETTPTAQTPTPTSTPTPTTTPTPLPPSQHHHIGVQHTLGGHPHPLGFLPSASSNVNHQLVNHHHLNLN